MYNKQTATCWCGAGINRRARPRDCRPAGHLLLRYLLRPAVPYVLGDRRWRRARLPRCAKLLQRRWLAFSVSLFSASSVVRHPILHASRQRIGKRRKSYSCRCMHALLRFFFILFRALCVRDVRTKAGTGSSARDSVDRPRPRRCNAVRLAARVRYIPARVNSRCMPIGYIGYYTFITLLVNS